jgi:hypothetical protein
MCDSLFIGVGGHTNFGGILADLLISSNCIEVFEEGAFGV